MAKHCATRSVSILSVFILINACMFAYCTTALAVQGGIDGISGIQDEHQFSALHPIWFSTLWLGACGGVVGCVLGLMRIAQLWVLTLLRIQKKARQMLPSLSNLRPQKGQDYAATSAFASTNQFRTVSGDDTPYGSSPWLSDRPGSSNHASI